jgi:hypothetical protein
VRPLHVRVAVLLLLVGSALIPAPDAFLPGGAFPGPLPAQAQVRSLEIERFEALMEVEEDGSVSVTETLTVRFTGSWNGIEREYSLAHRTAQGRRARLRIEVGEITDGDGTPLAVEESGGRNRVDLRIWVPGASDAVQTVVIPYRIRDGIRFFAGPGEEGFRDELYYNVTGTDWRIPILDVETRIRLPEGTAPLEVWGYTGPAGSTERAVEVGEGEAETRIRTTRPFGPGEGLTVSVTWPGGMVPRPTPGDRFRAGLRGLWPLGLPLLALVGMGKSWWRWGRDPRGRTLMVEYEPPEELTPAEGGTLVDHRAEIHDITSTLVDLAVRGHLRIEEIPGDRRPAFLGGRREEWIFHQRLPRRNWSVLAPHERAFLEGLFPPPKPPPPQVGEVVSAVGASFRAWRRARREGRGFDAEEFLERWIRESRESMEDPKPEEAEVLSAVKLSELENQFYQHLGKIRTKIYGSLKEKGLYLRRPDHQVQRWAGFGLVLVVLAIFAGIAMDALSRGGGLLPEPWAAGVGVGLSGLVVLLVAQGMGVRTEAGVAARDRVRGFREFLSRVEADYYRRVVLTPELFERYLPWAIALRVDARWARAFEGIYREPPEWYSGGAPGAPFRAGTFAAQMSSLSTRAGRSFSSSPSGSSGSGGGGSSGGGSGGGGGGGF